MSDEEQSSTYTEGENRWNVVALDTGYTRRDFPLWWGWEADCDPISDEYTPDEISAYDLFQEWDKYLQKRGVIVSGLVTISWFVRGSGFIEGAPAFGEYGADNPSRYDASFDPPTSTADGSPIDWNRIPVADKLWRPGRGDKGGFIQEATGWKPSVLQPTVPIGFLRHCAEVRSWT
ncbi:MAG: hypothetical protein JST91_20040 [Actinobacteria bacterium]|nr:hypothetical protein [Actinomycetota bacterium]